MIPKQKPHAGTAEMRVRVTKADVHMPDDSGKTAEQLQADIDRAGPKPSEGARRRAVDRKSIYLAEGVFQWRGDRRQDQWDRENHIYTLAKAIQDSDKPLDPLSVLPVGERYYVIDGHHRLAAYDTAGWTSGIPVEVFAGSLTEARLRALTSNVKDKLPMTAQAKSEAAWTITKENLGNLKGKEVAALASVSLRQVRIMKQAWLELNKRAGGDDKPDLMELTWEQARRLWQGKTNDLGDFDRDEWKQQKAQEVVDLIRKHHVAKGLLDHPEVTALALRMLSEKLPERLIEEWAGDHPELILTLAAQIEAPDESF